MLRWCPSVSERLFLAALVGVCLVTSACTDDSTAGPGTTSLPFPTASIDPNDGATAAIEVKPRSFDACAVLTEAAARMVLSLASDAPIAQSASGERCTWHDEGDVTRSVTLAQSARQDVSAFVADHPGVVDVASDDQRANDVHVFVAKTGSGAQITVLFAVGTYVLTVPEEPADPARLVTEMIGF